jgi:transcriptional regulator with XRE-family HTH domain
MKEARLSRNWSQEDMATFTGVLQNSISRYESGKVQPNADVIIKIAKALDVSTDYLLGLTDDPTPIDRVGQGLTDTEQALLAAARRGDDIGAIKIIVNKTLQSV